jgi:DNA ligase-associated metallophosphoesterase
MVPVSFASDMQSALAFGFAGEELRLAGQRALFWPRESALIVADLHLEKASSFARHGQMLPPYDSRATLERLAEAIRLTGARRVFCLGDNFHDAGGEARLGPHDAGLLAGLTRATDWVWITGNHDEKDADHVPASPGGLTVPEIAVGRFILRHHARPGETRPELSGHFHPKLSVPVRGKRVVRPCTLASETRLILPAFGAFTGGMHAADPAIVRAMQPARAIDAVIAAGDRLVRFPVWRAAA